MEPMVYEEVPWRVSFREYAWGAPNPSLVPLSLLNAALVKLLRLNVPSTGDEIPVRSLAPFEADPSRFDVPARAFIDEAARRLGELGFEWIASYRVEVPASATTFHLTLHRAGDGRSFALVKHRAWKYVKPPRAFSSVTFVTPLDDGTYLVTTSARPDMLLPPAMEIVRRVDAEPGALYEVHRGRCENRRVFAMPSAEAAVDWMERMHAVMRDHQLDRGAWRERSGKTAYEPAVLSAPYDRSANAPILRELIRMEGRRRSTWSGLILVAVTVAVFLAAGSAVWSWRFVALLVPVLLVHELGHYAAMKLFGYRDVRMFFIPLLGAAVSGHRSHVPGWKQGIVCLAGPVPSIVLAIAAGVGAVAGGQAWLHELALVALVLNGINLLPILPLDGGRIIDLTITSRHPMSDVAFRIATVVLLGLGFLATQDRVLMVLAVLIGIGIPAGLKLARVTRALRAEYGEALPAAEDGRIPLGLADEIATRIAEAFPRGLTAKNGAGLVRQCHTRISERPPGLLASLALLAAHGGAFLLAAVAMVGLVVAGTAGAGRFFDLAERQPAHTYGASETQTLSWPAEDEGTAAMNRVTLAATLPDAEASAGLWAELEPRLGPGMTLVHVAPVLLLELGASDPRRAVLADTLSEATADIVAGEEDSQWVPFNVSCLAPDLETASRLETAVSESRGPGPPVALIPPWHPEVAITEAQQSARATFVALTVQGEDLPEQQQEEVGHLEQRLRIAALKGDETAMAVLQGEIAAVLAAAWTQQVEAVRSRGPEAVDTALIDLYLEQPPGKEGMTPSDMEAFEAAWEAHSNLLGERMGMADDADPHRGLSLSGGYVERAGLVLHFGFLEFGRPALALPAFLAWLESQGAMEIRFEVVNLERLYGDLPLSPQVE